MGTKNGENHLIFLGNPDHMLFGSHGRRRVHELQRSKIVDKCSNKGLSEEDDFRWEYWENVSDRCVGVSEEEMKKYFLGNVVTNMNR